MKLANFSVIDNRPPYSTDQDDEFKTWAMAGLPLPRNERIRMSPMIYAYIDINTSRYPFRAKWKGANAGNDEVLTHQQTAQQVHRAYCKECREKHQKEKTCATNDNTGGCPSRLD